MVNNFQTIIFREVDETNNERGVWVRISPSQWGVSLATFREQPTEETPEWQAMTSVHFDPCFNNQSKITAWDEHSDPVNSDGREAGEDLSGLHRQRAADVLWAGSTAVLRGDPRVGRGFSRARKLPGAADGLERSPLSLPLGAGI